MSIFLTAPRPIRSVLIANRGEIACRVIATCRQLGLRSIAVHSEADAGARHVRLADMAVAIGPASAAESYLSIPRIIEAARQSGADAIHPGYGFLSENADFVQAVEDAGLIFVGPSPDAVRRMGSKITARHIAQEAGVLVVPGFDEPGADEDALAQAAARIGFPLLVKASAGGGGRGMRRVDDAGGLRAALESARAEAAGAFGDATVFLEKLIDRPRHIEVQVFGDGRGGALHLFDRDCSVQRNHQKLIEEAPAPNLPDEIRAALLDHAVRLTAAIGYAGAGTVEFVMGAEEQAPYFLEMNTRLQVEHPITEAICGIDLVEWQLRQAAGLPLPLTQDQIRPRGHAIEVRLNAERPEAGFMPDAGEITALQAPPGLRFDTGVEAGDTVGSHYDSLLAKLVAHGPDRDAARQALIAGIDGTALAGIGCNLALLRDSLANPVFAEGRATTAFLTETFPEGWQPEPESLLRLRGHAARAALAGTDDPQHRIDGFRIGGTGRVPLRIGDDYGAADITLTLSAEPTVTEAEGTLRLGPDPAFLHREGGAVQAALNGICLTLTARPLAEARMEARGSAAAEGAIRAPLTGRVTEVRVAVGDRVDQGAALVVMEAMKLVHTLTAPHAGRVTALHAAPGDSVTARSLLAEIETEEAT